MKIILDTNFLVDLVRFKVDVFEELRGNKLYILDSIKKELKQITKRKTKEAKLARLALELVKLKTLKTLKTKEKNTDKALLKYSKRGYIIATHDRILKNKLKKQGGKIAYIRQRRYVVIE